MAQIDEIKEEIGWLKFWIGVLVASFMGMVSFIHNNLDDMSLFSLTSAFVLTIALVFGVLWFNKRAIKLIRSLKDL